MLVSIIIQSNVVAIKINKGISGCQISFGFIFLLVDLRNNLFLKLHELQNVLKKILLSLLIDFKP